VTCWLSFPSNTTVFRPGDPRVQSRAISGAARVAEFDLPGSSAGRLVGLHRRRAEKGA
jgi:hypothetical protein